MKGIASIATAAPAQRLPSLAGAVLRHTFGRFAVAIVVMALLVYVVHEMALLEARWSGNDRGVLSSEFSMAMRLVGIPHFIIATLFLLTSTRLHDVRWGAHLFAALVVSVALGCGFFAVGGRR
ncbi:MAG: hypothetical protein HC809_09060, partial [Gammaproteobacteria bacterium]|nr:hypothetical protein [Gammaproteobacteria bacterium]